ncbi:MAG: CCA tRNA nucleotidyltransferase [Phycisphaerales bacterium]
MTESGPTGGTENPAGDALRARKDAVDVVRVLQASGYKALFAGGCVRDELLGLHPKDFDVATDARPKEIAKLFRSTAHVGAHFGVVIVRTGPSEGVEVATFRKDGSYTDNRRPDSVEFADDVADANRRDFTINALFLDPLAAEDSSSIHGHVVDHVGGMRDLDDRLIRAVGNPEDRLAEDHLRALRAVRFAARFDCQIDPATASAITEHAGDLAGVSVERIGQEVRRMLSHASRARAVELLADLDLERAIFGVHGDSSRARLSGLEAGADFPCAMAAWIIDRQGFEGKTRLYRDALCLSNTEHDAIDATIGIARDLQGDWLDQSVAFQKRLAARAEFAPALACVAAADLALADRIAARVDELRASPAGLAPQPLLTGEILISMGFQPGPAFKVVLSEVYDAQLEGRISDLEGAKSVAQKLLGSSEPGGDSGV